MPQGLDSGHVAENEDGPKNPGWLASIRQYVISPPFHSV